MTNGGPVLGTIKSFLHQLSQISKILTLFDKVFGFAKNYFQLLMGTPLVKIVLSDVICHSKDWTRINIQLSNAQWAASRQKR